ncbi:MAG TPA: hypothetical protein DHK64_08865 [Rhodobiaceae bacterium]|nr:hypothetical protein [Rhodobiaceae bacterium]|tara:strand:- start:39644 stop:39991 length:348 start_codon:yes stop_codon:yes gene_type:complete
MGEEAPRDRTRSRSETLRGKFPRDRPVGVLSDCVVHLYLFGAPIKAPGAGGLPSAGQCGRAGRASNFFECALWRLPGGALVRTAPLLENAGPARSASGIALVGGVTPARYGCPNS